MIMAQVVAGVNDTFYKDIQLIIEIVNWESKKFYEHV